jgi:hypothetical protein
VTTLALWLIVIELALFLLILWVAVRKPDSRWKEEYAFREELLGYQREAGMALAVRNEMTRQLIDAVRGIQR